MGEPLTGGRLRNRAEGCPVQTTHHSELVCAQSSDEKPSSSGLKREKEADGERLQEWAELGGLTVHSNREALP